MTSYFLRRLLLVIPTFLGITLLVFAITRMTPGGPVEKIISQGQQAMGEGAGGGGSDDRVRGQALSDEQIADLKAQYDFDKPIHIQYGIWLGKLLSGNLGDSYRYQEPVWDLIKDRLTVSTYYGVMTMIITYLVCIPLGVFKALKHKSTFDNMSSVLVFTGFSIPSFVMAIILLFIFAANLEWFPLGGFYGDEYDDMGYWEQILNILYHSVLPLGAYLFGSFAVMTVMMKNSLMDNLASDYVRTAISKGIDFPTAVRKHALRNSLIPIATHFGNNISVFLTGSFLIEKIFDIDGMGLLGYESVLERDYPVVMGILVVSSLLLLIGNILSDVCVAIVDPRIKFD